MSRVPSPRSRRGGPLTPAVDAPDLGALHPAEVDDLGPRAELLGRRLRDVVLDGTDLRQATLEECELVGVRVVDSDLSGLRLRDCVLTGLDAPTLKAPRTDWRDVALSHSRLGGVEIFDARWRSVRVSDSKLGFVNLRGSRIEDVIMSGCQIEELDLTGATATRVALSGCRIDQLTLTDATLSDVDLRGAELTVLTGIAGLAGTFVDGDQLRLLAPLFAAHLGVIVI